MPQRRFLPPWRAEEYDACFVVKDHAGHNLTYVYFENEPGCRPASKLLSRGEARRIAVNIAKLPELLKAPKSPRRVSASRRVRAAYPPSRG
jgi:hypothetical protein